ncbi:hypothetical protein [Pseudoalteromonas distincta]|uniref:hypothetical protein n=1 Tax=Pseudoalteromonas distincta TaxID=77608 RepID=UPI0011F0D80C|nr:hypothetical protein [Pseudoalteromonas distincta]KAA1153111.1 hypothetical protein EU511_18745 [Pseudoalteromonas distincta]
MEFTKKEVLLIKAAIKSKDRIKIIQPILLLSFTVVLLAMLFNLISLEEFTYLAIPIIYITILLPQVFGSPKHYELVDILEKQLPKIPAMEDVLSQELKKT